MKEEKYCSICSGKSKENKNWKIAQTPETKAMLMAPMRDKFLHKTTSKVKSSSKKVSSLSATKKI